MGVYGNFLNAFPELKRKITLFNEGDTKSEAIIAIYFDDNMVGMVGVKVGKQNTVVDIKDCGVLYVPTQYSSKVEIGDYLHNPWTKELMRITKRLAYDYIAGYGTWQVDKVTGSTFEQGEDHKIKEATFL